MILWEVPSSCMHLFMHATVLLNSASPSHPRLYRMILCCLRQALKPSATETMLFRSYINSQGARTPLRPTWFSVYASSTLFAGNSTHSATDATLDTGGWLDLTRQGLSPCKMHQASLGTLTPQFTDGVWWRFLCSAQNVTAHGVPQDCLVQCVYDSISIWVIWGICFMTSVTS